MCGGYVRGDGSDGVFGEGGERKRERERERKETDKRKRREREGREEREGGKDDMRESVCVCVS